MKKKETAPFEMLQIALNINKSNLEKIHWMEEFINYIEKKNIKLYKEAIDRLKSYIKHKKHKMNVDLAGNLGGSFYLEDKVADGLEAWRQPSYWKVSDGTATLQQSLVNTQATKDAADLVSTNRRNSYPSVGDQLDAIWKGGDDQAAMKVLVDKVKSDTPKPE